MRAEISNAAAVAAADAANSTFSDSSFVTSSEYDEADEDVELQDAGAWERRPSTRIVLPGYDETQRRLMMGTFRGNSRPTTVESQKKRSSEEVEVDDGEEEFEEEESVDSNGLGEFAEDFGIEKSTRDRSWTDRTETIRREASPTPISMKRIKLSEESMNVATPTRKRSSEEMEPEGNTDGQRTETGLQNVEGGAHKKVRSAAEE